jgi:hypothetical protein
MPRSVPVAGWIGLRWMATDVRGGAIENCGHWMPEEQPAALLARVFRLTHTPRLRGLPVLPFLDHDRRSRKF